MPKPNRLHLPDETISQGKLRIMHNSHYFDIIERTQDATGYVYSVMLLPSHSVYAGHFPNFPIAPGVCNLQMIIDCVSDAKNAPVELQSISRCKFTSLIRPDGKVLTIRFSLNENKLSATIHQDETLCIQLSATLRN